MAPQSISFIGDQDSVDLSSAHSMKIQQLFQPTTNHHHNQSKVDALNYSGSHGDSQSQLEASLGKLNISSGSRTYRIPSPTRPVMNSKSFQVSPTIVCSFPRNLEHLSTFSWHRIPTSRRTRAMRRAFTSPLTLKLRNGQSRHCERNDRRRRRRPT